MVVGIQGKWNASDKIQPDIGALHRHIQELLDEIAWSSKKKDEYTKKIEARQKMMHAFRNTCKDLA